MNRRTHSSGARAGATLVWLLAAVAALALAAGLALPSSVQVDDAAARRRTESALLVLQRAGREYFRDALAWPNALSELEETNGASTWSGPYVRLRSTHAQVGQSMNRVDGWGRAITVTNAGGTWTLRSAGSNATAGDADDLVLATSAEPLRSELTLERMAVLNRSIREYNDAHPATSGGGAGNGNGNNGNNGHHGEGNQGNGNGNTGQGNGSSGNNGHGNGNSGGNGGSGSAASLPADLAGLLAVLVAQSYLPTSGGYSTDAWGSAYVAVSDATGRVTGITSTHCDAQPVY